MTDIISQISRLHAHCILNVLGALQQKKSGYCQNRLYAVQNTEELHYKINRLHTSKTQYFNHTNIPANS